MNNEPVAWMSPDGKISDTEGKLFYIPLFTHPVKELHLSLQKTEDGELVAVTYTDDEHRIVEVLWEKPPVKEQEIKEANYGITTKWNGITTYHETIEPIGKVKELTQQEIDKIENRVYLKTIAKGKPIGIYGQELVKAILKRANEK